MATWADVERYTNALHSVTQECRVHPKTAVRWFLRDQLSVDKDFWATYPKIAEAIMREVDHLIDRGITSRVV